MKTAIILAAESNDNVKSISDALEKNGFDSVLTVDNAEDAEAIIKSNGRRVDAIIADDTHGHVIRRRDGQIETWQDAFKRLRDMFDDTIPMHVYMRHNELQHNERYSYFSVSSRPSYSKSAQAQHINYNIIRLPVTSFSADRFEVGLRKSLAETWTSKDAWLKNRIENIHPEQIIWTVGGTHDYWESEAVRGALKALGYNPDKIVRLEYYDDVRAALKEVEADSKKAPALVLTEYHIYENRARQEEITRRHGITDIADMYGPRIVEQCCNQLPEKPPVFIASGGHTRPTTHREDGHLKNYKTSKESIGYVRCAIEKALMEREDIDQKMGLVIPVTHRDLQLVDHQALRDKLVPRESESQSR